MSVLPVCPEHAHRSAEVSVDTRRGAALAVVAPLLLQRKERPEKVTVGKVRHTILNCSLHAYLHVHVHVRVYIYIYIYISVSVSSCICICICICVGSSTNAMPWEARLAFASALLRQRKERPANDTALAGHTLYRKEHYCISPSLALSL
jgi:hypothetical protein